MIKKRRDIIDDQRCQIEGTYGETKKITKKRGVTTHIASIGLKINYSVCACPLPASKKNEMINKIVNSIYPLSKKSLEDINSLIKVEYLKKGETFIKRNKRNIKEYFLLEGVCRSYLINPNGNEITITFFMNNSILSPYTTRTQKEISLLNFEALTDMKVASFNAKEFEKLMVDNLEIREFGNSVLRKELSQKVDKEIGLVSLAAKERLQKFREQFPMLENLVSHSVIASYLGITNVSLSRLRKNIV